MIHYARPHHVQVDVDDASQQMFTTFDNSRVIAIFPECSLAILPMIVFLARSPCHKLYSFWGSGLAF